MDKGKEIKQERWFKVPHVIVGQMTVRNAFPDQNKSALIPVNIIPEKEREADEKCGTKQKYVPGRKQLFEAGAVRNAHDHKSG